MKVLQKLLDEGNAAAFSAAWEAYVRCLNMHAELEDEVKHICALSLQLTARASKTFFPLVRLCARGTYRATTRRTKWRTTLLPRRALRASTTL